MSLERTVVIIDGGYLNMVLDQEFGRPKIDYSKFAQHVANGREILRTYYHYCEPYISNPPTEDERARLDLTRKFLWALRMLPRFEVRLGRLELRGVDAEGYHIYQQKRVDLQIGLDLVQHAIRRHIDYAVLVSGDSDLIPAVEAAKREGVVVRLVTGNAPHRDLIAAADERYQLTFADIEVIRAPAPRPFVPPQAAEANGSASAAASATVNGNAETPQPAQAESEPAARS